MEWFKSYLSDRQQFASFNSVNSLEKCIICGVPQGSVLGPLLFIIYIKDICNTSDIISFCLFADDTSLVYSDSNVDAAVQTFISYNLPCPLFTLFRQVDLKLANAFVISEARSSPASAWVMAPHMSPFTKVNGKIRAKIKLEYLIVKLQRVRDVD